MNMQKINFSAKDLVSRSCMQIKMFLEKPELRPKPNLNQWDGVDYQHKIALQTDGVIGEEMGNCFEFDEVRIYFSNDIVTKNKIIEVKNINQGWNVEEWYLYDRKDNFNEVIDMRIELLNKHVNKLKTLKETSNNIIL